MKRLLIILSLMLSFTGLRAQYEYQFNQLIKSIEFINPGYNAIQSNTTGTLLYSNQWNGFPGSPSTAGANIHMPLEDKHLGFGLLLSNESLGHRELRTVGVSVDADVRIGSDAYITMGIMGGYQIIDYNISDATTSYLEALSNVYNYNSTIVGSGLNLFLGHLHLGLSGYYNITPLEFETEFTNELSLYGNASYWFRMNDIWRIKLSGLYKTRGNYAAIAEGGAFFLLKDFIWFGASYRLNSATIVMADLKLSSFLSMGYSYAIGMGKLANFTGSSHEIMVRITVPRKSKVNTMGLN